MDRAAAQAAGLYTGFYYFAYLPDTTVKAEIIADAKVNKQKAEVKLKGFNTEIHEAYGHFKKAIKSL